MIIQSVNGEHSGHLQYHLVPHTGYDLSDNRQRRAVIIGAGPGGLMAALTIREEGYENVVVFEKRRHFTRMNIINLHPESLHIFQRLGILQEFLLRATLIVDHRNHIYAGGEEIYSFQDLMKDWGINPEHAFDVQDVQGGFQNETLYSISIADLQDLLARIAIKRGIHIVAEADVKLIAHPDGAYSLEVLVAEDPPLHIQAPQLIVLAEGSRGELYQSLGGRYMKQESLWPQETWVFGNFPCKAADGYSHLLFEFCEECDELTISNCIFLPRQQQVNIAVTVTDPHTSPSRIRELIAEQGAKILAVSGVKGAGNEVVWHSNQPVRIVPKTAARTCFGRNVVLVGDVNGSNSPVAALGGTLCTSAYSYAMRQLVHDLDKEDATVALDRYAERAQSYVKRWHHKVTDVRKTLNIEIRHTTMNLLVA